MAQFPALPLWTDSYLADTRHLTAQEHGAYLLLLMTAWRTRDCSLPNDDKKLARFASVSPRIWKKIKPNVLEFFDLKNEVFVQKRLTKERRYVAEKSNKQAQKANARWLKTKETQDAVASGGICQTDTPTPTPTPIKKEDTKVSLKENGAKKNERPKPKTGTRLAENWIPSEKNREYAKQKGFNDQGIERTAEDFRDYWTAKAGTGATKISWSKTWNVWIRKAADDGKCPNGFINGRIIGGSGSPSGRQSTGGIIATARELLAETPVDNNQRKIRF
jgi:uncharacterized protein YdaU (DUF1376 family)